jgi:hypothetical protein
MTMALLGLIAQRALKSFGGAQPAGGKPNVGPDGSVVAGMPGVGSGGGGLGDLLKGQLGGLLAGGAAGGVLSGGICSNNSSRLGTERSPVPGSVAVRTRRLPQKICRRRSVRTRSTGSWRKPACLVTSCLPVSANSYPALSIT